MGINLRKISGVCYNPEKKILEVGVGVIDELNYIKGLVAFLDHSQTNDEYSETGDLGRTLIYGWVDNRLKGLGDHIQAILNEEKNRTFRGARSRGLIPADTFRGMERMKGKNARI